MVALPPKMKYHLTGRVRPRRTRWLNKVIMQVEVREEVYSPMADEGDKPQHVNYFWRDARINDQMAVTYGERKGGIARDSLPCI